jgi:hypothetical protein
LEILTPQTSSSQGSPTPLAEGANR